MGNLNKQIVALLLLLLAQSAYAATYTLPDDFGSGPFSSCDGSGNCSKDIKLSDNTTIILKSDVSITLTGNDNFLSGQNLSVTNDGYDLNISARRIYIEDGSSVTANLTASDDVRIYDDVTVTGDLTADNDVEIGKRSTVNGDISAGDDVKIDDGSAVNGDITAADEIDAKDNGNITVTGNLSAGSDIVFGQDANITGNLTANNDIEIGQNSIVTGNSSSGDDIQLGDGVNYTGNLSSGDDMDLGDNITFNGDLNAGDDIDIGSNGTFYSDITAADNLNIDDTTTVFGHCTPSHPRCNSGADLSLTMSLSGTLDPEDSASYTLTVTNNGPLDHMGTITIVDNLPADLTYTGYSGSDWSCTTAPLAGPATITCTYGITVANGASASDLTLDVTAVAGAGTPITNSATVTGSITDSVSGNDTASVTYGTPTGPFCEDFELGLAEWTIDNSGGSYGTAVIETAVFNTGAASLRMSRDWVQVTSSAHDMTGTSGTISYWAGQGLSPYTDDPESGEDLQIEYLSTSGWKTLTTLNGADPGGTIYNGLHPLPDDAKHSGFQIRFTQTGGTGNASNDYDNWHLDTLCVGMTPPAPSTYAYYAMDESDWATGVTDSSGNNRTASVLGTATPTGFPVLPDPPGSARKETPGTCGVGTVPLNTGGATDGIDTGIDVNDLGNAGSIAFWYSSNTAWNDGTDRMLFDASNDSAVLLGLIPSDKHFYLVKEDGGRLRFALEDSFDSEYEARTSKNDFSRSFPANQWHHIAVTWDFHGDRRVRLYLDGTELDNDNIKSNRTLGDVATLYFGDRRMSGISGTPGNYTANSANGYIDEVRVYGRAITPSEVQADYLAVHDCIIPPTLDHFLISHDGFGINCVPEPITVEAIANNGSTFTGYTGTVTLDTGSSKGTWSLAGGTGVFSDTTANDGQATYTFDLADNGIASFNLSYLEGATPITITAQDGAAVGSAASLAFSPSGFTVTANALTDPTALPDSIVTQTAGKPFALHITAFGQTPTDPTCGIIESYTGDKNLTFWSDYNNPASSTRKVSVDGSAAATSEASATTAQTVTFTQGKAQVSANYTDVGLITLSMKDDSPLDPDLSTGIRGSSQFVVKPLGFCVASPDANADCASGDASCSAFVAAGDSFNLTVTAVAWESDTDSDLCNGNAVTPNYGLESPSEGAVLASNLVAPQDCNADPADDPDCANPALSGSFGSFGNDCAGNPDPGTACGTFAWPEVGIISLTPTVADGDYLNSGEDVAAISSGNIGRFIPADFKLELASPSPYFTPGCGPFSYTNQAFHYGAAPEVTVTARTASGGTTTNYRGTWWKNPSVFSASYAHDTGTSSLPAGVTLNSASAGNSGVSSNGNGTGTVTFSGPFAYNRSAVETDPFTGAIDLSFTIKDSDQVCYDGSVGVCATAQPFTINAIGFDDGDAATVADGEFRSGRFFAQDVYGTLGQVGDSLVMTAGTLYYDSTAGVWVANTQDSCSSYDYSVTDTGLTSSVSPTSPVDIANGYGDLTIQMTADDTTPGGSVRIDFSNWSAWLETFPYATATFGIFRGDDRFIYWREVE